MVCYEGIFFENDALSTIHSNEKIRLPIVNDILHCTFKYRPNESEILKFNEVIGHSVTVFLIGYACNNQNSGFLIRIPEWVEKEYYINYQDGKLVMPHITASLADGAKAVNTKNLKFELFSESIQIEGFFGYWIKDANGEYVSYKPYNRKKVNK